MAFPFHATPDPTLGDLKKAAREVIDALKAIYGGSDRKSLDDVERDTQVIYAVTARAYGLSEATLREAVQVVALI